MSNLIETYTQVVSRIRNINNKIEAEEKEIQRLTSDLSEVTAIRIEKLKEQLEKIDDYLLKIKAFQELAKKNLDSQNVLTIEAPPGYRVNLNRLRNWSMMIDPSSSNDPYAQRVYVVAKCDECFLEKKKKEFQDRIDQLQQDMSKGTNDDVENLKEAIKHQKKELKEYALSNDVMDFARMVVEENNKYWYKNSPAVFRDRSYTPECIAPGSYAAPFYFEKEQRAYLKTVLGEYYDSDNGRVLLPVEIPNNKEYVLSIICSPARRRNLDLALQNLILETINDNPAGTRKVFILDAVRFNSSSLGSLRQLEGTYAMEQVPRNPEQLTELLEQIVSSFADTDEVMELYDSVAEYNADTEKTKIPLSTIIVFGWSRSFEGRDKELLQRIMTNYERYGISLITVTYSNAEKNIGADDPQMPEYASQNAVRVSMLKSGTTVTMPDGEAQRFVCYTYNQSLSSDYVDTLKKKHVDAATIGNEYIKRYSMSDLPEYTREYKKIELPFGIDGKDQAHSLSFENENFAAYLVGASRSGKSTLLHTLIAGIIRNYHPDNVELWLADFKQLEFKRYMYHLPPHVKYILLDESTELVCNLIDRLTDEMMERQKLFARLGKQRIDQYDPRELDKPLPVIFVILDEFSIMSQAIEGLDIYKLKLQNILAKGAALGIKFLFSSQTFTTGVKGLTMTARAQVQQRIAMKGTREEISETLELSSRLKTEQVMNWMEALPPHYALVKYRLNADTLPLVKRYLVMYFKDYAVRDDMIDMINSNMHAVEEYNPKDLTSYVNKYPVLVDGNSFNSLSCEDFLNYVKDNTSNKTGMDKDDIYLSFGTPRLMMKYNPAVLSRETRENIILFARAAEQACCASILFSSMILFAHQGGKVQIWAYERNRLYLAYKEVFSSHGFEIVEGMEAICTKIRSLKEAVRQKEAENTLIVLLGMDRVVADFDFDEGAPAAPKPVENKLVTLMKNMEQNGAIASNAEEVAKALFVQKSMMLNMRVKKEAAKYNWTKEQIEEEIQKGKKQIAAEIGYDPENPKESISSPEEQPAEIEQTTTEQTTAEQNDKQQKFDPGADFVYLVKQGSRLGYHFLLTLNSFADLKPMQIKLDLFRHRIAFQLSVEDSREVFLNKNASVLPEHIAQYDDSFSSCSVRPYLHPGISWDGWYIEEGKVISPYAETLD